MHHLEEPTMPSENSVPNSPTRIGEASPTRTTLVQTSRSSPAERMLRRLQEHEPRALGGLLVRRYRPKHVRLWLARMQVDGMHGTDRNGSGDRFQSIDIEIFVEIETEKLWRSEEHTFELQSRR